MAPWNRLALLVNRRTKGDQMKTSLKYALLTALGFGVGFAAVSAVLYLKDGEGVHELDVDPSQRVKLDWGQLRTLNLQTGEKSPVLKQADGRVVEIPGFMVPLEDEATKISEFLLVPSPQACVHVPAPPPNQMVHVKMASGIRTSVAFGPIWLVGKLQITDYSGPYGTSSFFVTGISTRPYE